MKERVSEIPVVFGGEVATDSKAIVLDHNDDAAILDLAKKELVNMLATPGLQAGAKLAIIRELLDRIEGKPMVRTQNLNVTLEKRTSESDNAILERYKQRVLLEAQKPA